MVFYFRCIMKWKTKPLISKSPKGISQELTMTLSWSLFLRRIQTYSCVKIKSLLKELLKLTGTDYISWNLKSWLQNLIRLSGYALENGFVSKLFSMMNVDIDSQTVSKSTNRLLTFQLTVSKAFLGTNFSSVITFINSQTLTMQCYKVVSQLKDILTITTWMQIYS